MKKILFSSLLFSSLLLCFNQVHAQQDIDEEHITLNYNFNTNTLSATYDECRDPCTRTNDRFCDREDCIDKCVENFQNGTISGISELANCIEGCGPAFGSGTQRTAVGFQAAYLAAFNNIPFNPFDGTVEQIDISFTPVTNGEINIPSVTPQSPWPQIYQGNNTCFLLFIRVFYDDQTFCEFVEVKCNLVG